MLNDRANRQWFCCVIFLYHRKLKPFLDKHQGNKTRKARCCSIRRNFIKKLITNNPLAKERFSRMFQIEYYNKSYFDILICVRDYIHKGHWLLTHPLSGSIKPNETPYKSVLISKQAKNLDLRSLSIIEESIVCCDKFNKNHLQIPKHFCIDYMEVDCDFIAKCEK